MCVCVNCMCVLVCMCVSIYVSLDNVWSVVLHLCASHITG